MRRSLRGVWNVQSARQAWNLRRQCGWCAWLADLRSLRVQREPRDLSSVVRLGRELCLHKFLLRGKLPRQWHCSAWAIVQCSEQLRFRSLH